MGTGRGIPVLVRQAGISLLLIILWEVLRMVLASLFKKKWAKKPLPRNGKEPSSAVPRLLPRLLQRNGRKADQRLAEARKEWEREEESRS